MNFSELRAGDTVFIEEAIRTGFYNSSFFFVPKKVERLTASMAFVCGKRYWLSDGRMVGGGYRDRIYLEKEDQTKERDDFIGLIKSIRRVEDKIGLLKLNPGNKQESINDLEAAIDKFLKNETLDV